MVFEAFATLSKKAVILASLFKGVIYSANYISDSYNAMTKKMFSDSVSTKETEILDSTSELMYPKYGYYEVHNIDTNTEDISVFYKKIMQCICQYTSDHTNYTPIYLIMYIKNKTNMYDIRDVKCEYVNVDTYEMFIEWIKYGICIYKKNDNNKNMDVYGNTIDDYLEDIYTYDNNTMDNYDIIFDICHVIFLRSYYE